MSRNYDSSSASSSTQPSSVGRASLDNEALDVKNRIKETEDVELPAKKDAGKVKFKLKSECSEFCVIKLIIEFFLIFFCELKQNLGWTTNSTATQFLSGPNRPKCYGHSL